MINFEHQCLSFPTCMASPMAGWTHGPTHPWHRLGDVCPTVDSWISKPLYGGVLLAGHSVEWTLPAAPTCCTILGSPLVATSHGLVPVALWDLPPLVGSLVLCWHWNLAWLAWKGLVAHWEGWLWRRLHLAWLDWEGSTWGHGPRTGMATWWNGWPCRCHWWHGWPGRSAGVAWCTWWHDLAHLPRWQHCWWPHCLDWSRRWWLHWLAWMAFWCQTTQAGRLCQWICCLSVQCWWCFNTKNKRSNLLGIHVDRSSGSCRKCHILPMHTCNVFWPETAWQQLEAAAGQQMDWPPSSNKKNKRKLIKHINTCLRGGILLSWPSTMGVG